MSHTSHEVLTTSTVSIVSHAHSRRRREQRQIEKRELQAAVLHGKKEPANPGSLGEVRWRYTYNGVVYITDESSRNEITCWRADGADCIQKANYPDAYGAHVVIVVDGSGSMRKADVPGSPSRRAAVYRCLAQDFVLAQLASTPAAAKRTVVSLVEMKNTATVLLRRVPQDYELYNTMLELADLSAESHGNYLPALDAAAGLLKSSDRSAQLALIFLSDGAPSDHTCTACTHGVYVWQPVRNESRTKDQRGRNVLRTCHVGGDTCRHLVSGRVRSECLSKVRALGETLGRERLAVTTVGFGPPNETFVILKEMAAQLPRGTFCKLGLCAHSLRTAISSLASSISSMATAVTHDGKMLTPRRAGSANGIAAVSVDSAARSVNASGWHRCLYEAGGGIERNSREPVLKYMYKSAADGLMSTTEMQPGAAGIAFQENYFAKGAERMAHVGAEVGFAPMAQLRTSQLGEESGSNATVSGARPELVRLGPWLIVKLPRYEEQLYDREFAFTFCRVHHQAEQFARVFNERVREVSITARDNTDSATITFVQCAVYRVPNPFCKSNDDAELACIAGPHAQGHLNVLPQRATGDEPAASCKLRAREYQLDCYDLAATRTEPTRCAQSSTSAELGMRANASTRAETRLRSNPSGETDCGRSPPRWLHVLTEPELRGHYQKWNSNNGQVKQQTTNKLAILEEEEECEEWSSDELDDEEHSFDPLDPEEVPQAFSHFTFKESNGKELVCDLQGVWDARVGFTLTDPAIHSSGHHFFRRSGRFMGECTSRRNGATDKGVEGMKAFFRSHTCGDLCLRLNLRAFTL